MADQKATNIIWHQSEVNQAAREELLKQKGVVIWFTGLSGSGKSTVANQVANDLHQLGKLTYVLDGDNIRHGLNKNLGFSPEDREENIRRIGEVAKLFVDAGVITTTAFISPYRKDRDKAREVLEDGRFIEVFVDCPLEVCENRDPKGLYKKARAGEIKGFTGIDAPYEAPEKAEIVINTNDLDLAASTQKVIDYLSDKGSLS
ncbi:adenylyl-sulfate kinase [Candidatus Poribacteria bacterium]|nr:adenylyl-sulfate kinase [Candidatus Poribacteria bacterium]MDP6595379.1 adenylyl-sulfate kinase [Candidatus Poribacteria bacterium]MDP6746299.1 adenylyl-sulfate kinase [Candidatus Poribacteria bacterium]MDP6995843.1 adenylyl-sulfate kinase [Candidatus Poribacteria bacterium]MDP7278563.1 adenylyl-sulfate kinase [Candidatus Poribacteria bacterium]